MKPSFIIIVFCCLASCSETKKQKVDTVQLGKQVWMKSNLDVVMFRNGDSIDEASTNQEWEQARFAEKPAWCYVNNNPHTNSALGKLYNWYAVNDRRGLAPDGWHIPVDSEWADLAVHTGSKMFCIQRAGTRTFIGEFENKSMGFWWSATGNESYDKQYAWYRVVGNQNDSLHRATYVKGSGFSVRCIRDLPN